MTNKMLNNVINKFKLNPSVENFDLVKLGLTMYRVRWVMSRPKIAANQKMRKINNG